METSDTLNAHKILVVDDEPDLEVLVRQRFRRAIRSGQFEFIFAHNGVEALDALRKNNDIAVVLTDINMPQMDGLTLLSEIENLAKEANRVAKAVVVSAYSDMQNIRTAMNRGAFDFLVKPIDFQDVEITLGKTLNYVQEIQNSRKAEEYRLGKLVAEANFSQLQELEALRDSMVHMIVHDLRTPLTGVITGLQSVLQVGELNPIQEEFLSIANSSSEILLNMVNDLLNISKMESGTLEVNRRTIAMDVLVQRTLAQVSSLARHRSHQLSVHVAADLPSFEADEDLLCRVLVNLISNSIKFTPAEGSIELNVRTAPEHPNTILFSVKDTGHGIPSDQLENIFEKFAQVRGMNGSRSSTGLGLTYCKLTVEAHGGRIWVESEIGRGSVFNFTLPH